MLKLIKRIWQWLRGLLGRSTSGASSSPGYRRRGQEGPSLPPLTDTDYEFLLSQLLDGVAHGWHEGRILKFFERLGERGKGKLWVGWLERFGKKVLASPAPNLTLAARLIRLGELCQSFAPIQPVGQAAYQLGRELYAREAVSAVWEYEGPDALGEEVSQGETAAPEGEAILLTPEELLAHLQQDEGLAAQLAGQLGLETDDPQALVEQLLSQAQAGREEPQTVEDWFNRGLQQANLGNLTEAIASWEQALALNPNLPQAWQNRGSALGNLGDNEGAIASFDRALALNPEDPQIWNAKGSACYNLQQWEESLACWERAVELQPDFYQAWCHRGSALEHLGRIGEAIASYQKSLEIQPDFALALAKLQALEEQG